MNKFLTKLFDDKERLFQVICVFLLEYLQLHVISFQIPG